jgi:hypothetical protein
MRRIALIAVSAGTALALSATPAFAVQSKQQLSAKISSPKTARAASAKNVGLMINPYIEKSAADAPFATTNVVTHFDKNLFFNGAKFASCTAGQVQTGNCSAKAKVGSGSAMGLALGLKEPLKVTAYNGDKGRTLLMHVTGTEPLLINSVLVGKLSRDKGKYGGKLTTAIPQDLQQPSPGAIATLLDFRVTVKAGTAANPFVGLLGCTKGGLNVKGDFTYTDGTKQTVATKAACRA